MNISPSNLLEIKAAGIKMGRAANDKSFPTRGNMYRLKGNLSYGGGVGKGGKITF